MYAAWQRNKGTEGLRSKYRNPFISKIVEKRLKMSDKFITVIGENIQFIKVNAGGKQLNYTSVYSREVK